MNEGSTYPTSVFWFLAGGIAGAAVALLLAPQSGKTTRQMMARKASGTADSVRELTHRVVARGEGIWDETALRVGEAASALAGNGEGKAGRSEAPPA